VPGEELGEPLDGMIGDAAENADEPGLRVDIVELGRGDQGVDRRGALAAAVRCDLMMPGVWDTR
jgi:hypothetical protein